MNTNEKFNIKNGPSKHVLIDAFKYAYDPAGIINLDFKVEISKGEYAKLDDFNIIAISHEDGSGESFNLSGWCRINGSYYSFTAYYSTKHREGVIEFKK